MESDYVGDASSIVLEVDSDTLSDCQHDVDEGVKNMFKDFVIYTK